MSAPTSVACPTCWAKPGDRCRTTTTHRMTDTHDARYAAACEPSQPEPSDSATLATVGNAPSAHDGETS